MSNKRNNTGAGKRTSTKIAAYELDKAVHSAKQDFTNVEWNGLTIKVRHMVNFEYMLRFVNGVVNTCFETGSYMPELKDFAIRCASIAYYTNINMPEDVDKQYKLVYGTDLVAKVLEAVDHGQFNNILLAIDKKLEYRANTNIEKLIEQVKTVTESLETASGSLSKTFDSVSREDIEKVIGAITDGKFDESKLAKAFVSGLVDKAEGK